MGKNLKGIQIVVLIANSCFYSIFFKYTLMIIRCLYHLFFIAIYQVLYYTVPTKVGWTLYWNSEIPYIHPTTIEV